MYWGILERLERKLFKTMGYMVSGKIISTNYCSVSSKVNSEWGNNLGFYFIFMPEFYFVLLVSYFLNPILIKS